MLTAAAVVVCALDLLGRSASSTVPIKFLDAAPRGASQYVEAFVMRDPDTIYLITTSAAFRDAQNARTEWLRREGCLKIASVIVHEEWHLRHGDDEEGAYQAQLMALTMLNARSPVITSVRRSMQAVLAAQRARPTPELLAARR
jgi:hypothetical protein